MNDQYKIEDEFEDALQERTGDDFKKFSPYKKDKVINKLKSTRKYLQDHYPDSYTLGIDISEYI